jgi:hypothetical protein
MEEISPVEVYSTGFNSSTAATGLIRQRLTTVVYFIPATKGHGGLLRFSIQLL